jgi:hypothetical protein
MSDYYGITLNDPNDTGDWSTRERTVFRNVIDLLGMGPDYPGTTGNPRTYDMIMGVTGAGDPASIALGVAANVAPRAPIDIVSGDAGATPAITAGTGLIVENSANSIIQMYSPAANNCVINFGDPAANNPGHITYNHAVDFLLADAAAGVMLQIGSVNQTYTTTTGTRFGSGGAPAYRVHMSGDGDQCRLHQSGPAGLVAPLYLDQDDVNVQFTNYDGESVLNSTVANIIDYGDAGVWAAGNIIGLFKIYVTDARVAGVSDGEYWVPFYTPSQ